MSTSRLDPVIKTATVVVLCGLCIAVTRPRVTALAAAVKERDTSYSLPPTEALRAVSMGYRSALADLVWAHVLVTQGIRAQEKRPFDHLKKFLDAINELDPKFRAPYVYADSLLTWQVNDPDKKKSLREGREVLERGLREFPEDANLWLNYGEFLAYVGAAAFEDEATQEEWRKEGARAMMRAGELGSKDENLMWHTVAAANLLDKDTERTAIMHYFERVYATTEDPELRENLEKKLRALSDSHEESKLLRKQKAFEAAWRQVPMINRTQFRLMGPPVPTWRCAGPLGEEATKWCGRDWMSWSRAQGLGE